MGAFDDLYQTPGQQNAGAFGDLNTPETQKKYLPYLASPKPQVSIIDKLVRGMVDPLDGAAQLFEKLMPDSFNDANWAVNNWIADKTGLLNKVPVRNAASLAAGQKPGVEGLIQQQEADYQAKRRAAGEDGFDGYRMAGNVASPMNFVVASKIPAAKSLIGQIGAGALGGASSGALNPVYGEGDYWAQKATQALTGAGLGGLMPALTAGMGRIISPKASTNPDLQMLKSEGVTPTIGQTLGGMSNSLEEKAQSIPIVGDMIAAARGRAREQFNNAAINRATGKIGQSIEGSGTESVARAGDMIGKAYDSAKSMMGNFQIDQKAAQELARLQQMAQQLPGKERMQFQNAWSTLQNQLTPNGHLLADGFKTLDSKLTKDAARFSGSNDAYQQQLGDALKEMQRVILENAKRANPKAAQLFNQADAAYANLVRVEGASVGAKATDGVFTPGQLLSAVRGADQSVRDRTTARGTALMQDLAMAGQKILGNKIPDSGTAGRVMSGGAGYAAAVNPVGTVAGLLGGTALYSSPVQNMLRGLVSTRPQGSKAVADAFNEASPYFVPLGAQMGLGLLNY